MSKPKLLLVELHHSGDAVMLLPLVRGAMQSYEVTVLCRPSLAEIFRLLAAPPDILEWEPPWMGGARRSPPLGGEPPFDVAASVWPDPRVHAILGDSGAGRRIGFSVALRNWYGNRLAWRRRRWVFAKGLEYWNRLRRVALTEALQVPKSPVSHWRRPERLAGPLGVTPDYRVPWLACPPGAIPARFDAFVKTHREQGREIWLVHPGARHPVRRWPLHHFEELIAACSVLKNAAIVCVEDADAGKWSCAGDRFFIWKPARLEALAAGMAMCDAVLANDSLPSHLAAAMGVNVWTLFTSQEPALFAPWNNEGRTISVDVCPHRPCLDRCVMPSVICRDRLSVGRVAERLAESGD